MQICESHGFSLSDFHVKVSESPNAFCTLAPCKAGIHQLHTGEYAKMGH